MASGICTSSNDRLPLSNYQLISEYSESNINKIFQSSFMKGKFPTMLNENINRSIRSGQTILLDSAGEGVSEPLNELAMWLSYKWPIGKEISVKILNCNDSNISNFIASTIQEWEKHAYIKFKFVSFNENADIRISITYDLNSWSKIGTSCLGITNQQLPTMNLGCFINGQRTQIIRATVLHEFGHALGCIHEHQSPSANILWDESAIRRAFKIIPGWDEQKIQINIISRLPQSDISNSEYDKDSIMHYYYPDYFTLNKQGVEMNLELSQQDKDFISACYPF